VKNLKKDYEKILLKAAEVLEKSAQQMDNLKKEKEDLQIQNTRLQLSLAAKERSKRSVELAELMFEKGMINKGEVLEKSKEIMKYDDKAFQILKETVESASPASDEIPFKEDLETEKEANQDFDRKEESKMKTVSKLMELG
jgi:hypothetical protein